MRIEYCEEKALTACLTYKTGFEGIIGKQPVEPEVELVSKELNHLADFLHVYAGSLIFMQ